MAESLRSLLAADLANALRHNGDVLNEQRASVWRRINVLLTPCMGVSLLHRLAHSSWHSGWVRLASGLARIDLLVHHIDVHPACEIRGGMYIPHPAGIVIRAHAGQDFVVLAHGSICDDGFSPPARWPRFEDDVWVAAGARVTGNLRVGSHARVGPGAILTVDLPADSLIRALPTGECS